MMGGTSIERAGARPGFLGREAAPRAWSIERFRGVARSRRWLGGGANESGSGVDDAADLLLRQAGQLGGELSAGPLADVEDRCDCDRGWVGHGRTPFLLRGDRRRVGGGGRRGR